MEATKSDTIEVSKEKISDICDELSFLHSKLNRKQEQLHVAVQAARYRAVLRDIGAPARANGKKEKVFISTLLDSANHSCEANQLEAIENELWDDIDWLDTQLGKLNDLLN